MDRTLTIGRWELGLYQRAIHIIRTPRANPRCLDCYGEGGHHYLTDGGEGDWTDCHCLSLFRSWRIPYGPRPRRTWGTEVPF